MAAIDDSVNSLIATQPLRTASSLMDNQNIASQIALRQAQQPLIAAQAAGQELENKKTQIALDDDAAMRQWLSADPKNYYAMGKGDFTGLVGKVSPTTLLNLQKGMFEAAEAHAKLGTAQLGLHDKTLGEIQNGFDGLLQMPTDEQRASAWPALVAQWKANGYLQGLNVPDTITGNKDELMQIATPLQLAKGLNDAAMERAKTKAETEKDTAAGKKDTAEAAKIEVEQQLTQHKLDLYNTLLKTPQALETRIAQSIDPVKYPDLYKRAVNEARSAPDLEGINGAAQKYAQMASEQERSIAVESNPTVLAARRDSALAQAKALREGDNPALSGVPPAAAASAVAGATKLDGDYIKAREAVEAMGKLLDLADQGNVAAGANIPMVGVGAANAINGIRRINSAEIAQYGTAGSLLQKIQGKLQGWAEGQPIPASVRDDIRELHQQLGDDAYRQYTSGLNALNQRTGAKFGPTVDPPNIRKAQAKPIPPAVQTVLKNAAPGIHTLSDGTKWMKAADGTITAQ